MKKNYRREGAAHHSAYKRTRDLLKNIGKKGETYDEIIIRLVRFELNQRVIDCWQSKGVINCTDCDIVSNCEPQNAVEAEYAAHE